MLKKGDGIRPICLTQVACRTYIIMIPSLLFTADIDLVEPAINGIVSYVYTYIAMFFSWAMSFFSGFVAHFSPTSTKFFDMTSSQSELYRNSGAYYNSSVYNIFITFGIIVLLLVFIVNLIIIGMPTAGEKKNTALGLICRFFVAGMAIFAIKPFLFDIINKTFENVMYIPLKSYFSGDGQFALLTTATNQIQNKDMGLGAAIADTVIGAIVFIFIFLAISIEFIKYILEIIERYIVTMILLVASPSAAATLVSNTTENIFWSYIRMYISQLFLLVMSLFFTYLSLGAMQHCITDNFGVEGLLFCFTLIKCAERVDQYMRSLGLSVAQTGGSVMGAVLSAGMALAGLGKAKGALGNAAQNLGARTGNFKLANLGQKLQRKAQPIAHRQAKSQTSAQALANFADKGGFGNLKGGVMGEKNAAAIAEAAQEAFKNGQYNAISNMPINAQTEAVKKCLTADGTAKFKAATGIDAKNIKAASVLADGSIKGTASVRDTNGKIHDIAFSMSTNANMSANPNMAARSLGVTKGMIDGQQRYISAKGTTDITNGASFNANYSEVGANGHSITSTITGAYIDNAAMSNAGVTFDTINNGTIYHSNMDGQNVGMTNIASGISITCGSEGNLSDMQSSYSSASSGGTESLKSSYSKFVPDNATVNWGNTNSVRYNSSNNSVDVRWQRDGQDGITHISRPQPQDIQRGSKTKIVHSGQKTGDYAVKHEYMKREKVGGR